MALRAGQRPNLLSERGSVTRSRVNCGATRCGSQSRAPQIRTLPRDRSRLDRFQILELSARDLENHCGLRRIAVFIDGDFAGRGREVQIFGNGHAVNGRAAVS